MSNGMVLFAFLVYSQGINDHWLEGGERGNRRVSERHERENSVFVRARNDRTDIATRRAVLKLTNPDDSQRLIQSVGALIER